MGNLVNDPKAPPLGGLSQVNCARCRDSRFIPGDEFQVFLPCPDCMTDAELLATHGVPLRLRGKTAADLQRLPGKGAALSLLETWDMTTSVVLHSAQGDEHATWGAGKSQIAALLLLRALQVGKRGRWTSSLYLLDSIRSTFDDQSGSTTRGMIAHWANMPILVIDDLGAERGTDWVIEQMRRLIEERDAGMRTTIITTNATGPAHLEAKLGDAGGAVVSRLKRALWVSVGGRDMRGENE